MTEPTALEPTLDKVSLSVLRALPACGEDEWRPLGLDEAVTVWQVGEVVDSINLPDVLLTLNGLVHLDYARTTDSRSRGRPVWWRTRKGDEAARRAAARS